MNVRLIAVTEPVIDRPRTGSSDPVVRMTPEELIVYTARVSNPAGQENLDTGERLLRYCLRMGHFSIFEQVDMTVEVETSRAIAAQILRHRSFTFQEFSQRYATADLGFEDVEPRRQDAKNRQNSIDDLPETVKDEWASRLQITQDYAETNYNWAMANGIAKECARFLLPLSTRTRLYMKGSLRSWIHYLQVRTDPSTQCEHRDVALAIKDIFAQQFPVIDRALEETNR